jgi:hypothetical protein
VARPTHVLCVGFAWGLRGSVDGTSMCRRQTGAHRVRPPSGFLSGSAPASLIRQARPWAFLPKAFAGAKQCFAFFRLTPPAPRRATGSPCSGTRHPAWSLRVPVRSLCCRAQQGFAVPVGGMEVPTGACRDFHPSHRKQQGQGKRALALALPFSLRALEGASLFRGPSVAAGGLRISPKGGAHDVRQSDIGAGRGGKAEALLRPDERRSHGWRRPDLVRESGLRSGTSPSADPAGHTRTWRAGGPEGA